VAPDAGSASFASRKKYKEFVSLKRRKSLPLRATERGAFFVGESFFMPLFVFFVWPCELPCQHFVGTLRPSAGASAQLLGPFVFSIRLLTSPHTCAGAKPHRRRCRSSRPISP